MLDNKVIENVLFAALSRGGDFAEDKYNSNVRLVGRKVIGKFRIFHIF